MLGRIRFETLIIFTASVLGCKNNHESKQSMYSLETLATQSKARVELSLNDVITVNTTNNTPQWWVLTADKNSTKKLNFKFHVNNRQHTLSFNKPGEFNVVAVKSTSHSQVAQYSRNLTLVVIN